MSLFEQKNLPGLSNVRRTCAAKQINDCSYDGPSKPGTDSAPEARATNASFDRSIYQNIVKSMREGK